MAQSDRSPRQRGDSTRPATVSPGRRSSRRPGGDRRPYPTATTLSHISPGKPAAGTTRTRSRGAAATSIPATVWPSGTAPIDLDATWPVPIVKRIVRAFSAPGARVVLLPWPTPHPTPSARRGYSAVGPDGTITTAPDTDSGTGGDTELAGALATIDELGRTSRVVHLDAGAGVTGAASRPFWADLVTDTHTTPEPASAPCPTGAYRAMLDGPDAVVPDADLIITSLSPQRWNNPSGDHTSDLVALAAARLLRVGGILTVLTHSDTCDGVLVDPTGVVVAAAQNADLLYLQHIVALHTPVRDGRFDTTHLTRPGTPNAQQRSRAEHRASVRDLPAPHQRVHSDLLVFAQPHEYDSPVPATPGSQAVESGVIG